MRGISEHHNTIGYRLNQELIVKNNPNGMLGVIFPEFIDVIRRAC
jgi:hypothetical protein